MQAELAIVRVGWELDLNPTRSASSRDQIWQNPIRRFLSREKFSQSDPIWIFWKQIRPDFPTGKYDFMSDLKDISYYI